MANEGCVAKLPFLSLLSVFQHLLSLLPPYLLSLRLPSSLPVPVCIVGVVIRSPQHRDLLQSRVVWCFSVSVAAECCRRSIVGESVPNGNAVPATALPPLKGRLAKYEQQHPSCVHTEQRSFASGFTAT